jgi:hypothetical protein
LSSWLLRVAFVYRMSVEQLVRHNLGEASFELVDRNGGALDRDPPPGVLDALHERTGIPREQLREMTIAGWTPWLLDTLDPAQGAAAFDTYVRGDSVLLAPGEAVPRHLPTWRAWLPEEPMRRACPRCLCGVESLHGETAVFTLVSQIPLTISCPLHGYRLEATSGSLGTFIAWQDPHMEPTPADPHVAAMDRRTHEGLATGTVTLPGRPVHVAVWLRLLRTLLDELNTPASYLRASSRTTLQRIWQATGQRTRAGQTLWHPYETLTWPVQQAMLHAAAVALDLIETGQITAGGSLGPVLHDGPHRPVHDGGPTTRPTRSHQITRPEQITTAGQAVMASLREVIDIARHDPGAAQRLLATLTSVARTQASYDRARTPMIEMGVPVEFLPTYQEATVTATPS